MERIGQIRSVLIYYALIKCNASVQDMRQAIKVLENKYVRLSDILGVDEEIYVENIKDLVDFKENRATGKAE